MFLDQKGSQIGWKVDFQVSSKVNETLELFWFFAWSYLQQYKDVNWWKFVFENNFFVNVLYQKDPRWT